MPAPIVHRVIDKARANELRALHFPNSFDSYSDQRTEHAMENQRPAFWGFVSYHNAVFCFALDVANDASLDEACRYIHEAMRLRGRPYRDMIREFLDLLAPANLSGLGQIDKAMWVWLDTFIEPALFGEAVEEWRVNERAV